ncbi:tetratricopeptide repeat protein [bacterium]|nr:tetratricopeptide repeat protein [bacterium]MCI0603175.1 tetratricopeptide repeat protein [bacterium]
MAKLDKQKVEKFRKGELTFAQLFDINAKQVASLLVTGHQWFEQGRLKDARNIFEGLALLDARNPYVHGILGAINQKEEKYEAAIEWYDMALNIFEKDVNLLTNRGEVCLKLGAFEQAAKDFKKATELDPGKKHPAANRARMLILMTQEALKLAKVNGVSAITAEKKRLDQLMGKPAGK